MQSIYIIPYVKSIQNVFQTMLQLSVDVGEPSSKQPGKPSYDVSGIIGMSGTIQGNVVLSFPTATAERIVSLFTGCELAHTHADFADAIGELVNMVCGGAKAMLAGEEVNISCPSVVVGSDHQVFGRSDAVCIVVPCTCDCGEFAMEISLRQAAAGSAAASAAAQANL